MSSIGRLGPTDTQCEICSKPLRVMPFPGLHHLCPDCSKEVNERIKPAIERAILDLKEEFLTKEDK